MVSSDSSSYISPVQRLYLEISQPAPSKPAPKVQTAAPALKLEWADVEAILKRKRDAMPEELQYAVQHAREFQLSSGQVNDLSVRLTIALANRAKPAESPNAELFSQLDILETRRGLLHNRGWFEREMRAGANAIANCKRHRPPRCSCWKEARERLWYIQDAFGSRSVEAWAATRLWETFEEYELASRPEPTPGLNQPPQQLPEESEDLT